MRILRKLAVTGLGVGVAGVAGTALAQEVALEEMVVTAQKRTENMQEVPIAVSALTGDAITESGIDSLQEMAGSVPGLVVTNSLNNGAAPISIRGIGGPSGGGSIFNDEPVGIYIDGVYIARFGASVQDMVDLESVQVLRGPQGTLYGRNSTAGAVLLTTKRPTDRFEANASLNYDSLQTLKLTGVVSGPLAGEAVLGRLAVGYGDGGDYAKNIATGKDVGGAENKTVRGSLRFSPNADVTVDVIGTYADQWSTPVLYAVAALSGSSPGYTGNPFVVRPNFQQAIERDRVAMDDDTHTQLKSHDATVLVNWQLGGLSLDSITGYRKLINDGTTDSDAQANAADYADATGAIKSSSAISATRSLTPGWDGLLRNRGHQVHKEWTEELRLQSANDGAFKWTTGLYYLHEDNLFDFTIENWQSRVPVTNNPPAAPWGTSQNFYATQQVDAYAAFADATYAFNEQWSLTAGARYSDEKKTMNIQQTPRDLLAGNTHATLPVLTPAPASASYSNFSPRAVVNYKPQKDTLLYLSFSKGFKSGGYNSFDPNVATNNYPEERINAYELGLKSDFADNRIRTNLSIFNYDYTNVQLRQAVFTGGVSIRTVPKSQVKGVELESTLVASEALTVRANVSYLDAQLKHGTLSAIKSDLGGLAALTYGGALAGPSAVALGTEDVAGHRMARAPKWQGYLNGDYKLSVGEALDAHFGVTWRYQSKVFFSETNQDTQAFMGKAWNEVDVRAALLSVNKQWQVALLGQNVLNNRHVTQTTPFSGFPVATVNLPARVALQLTWRSF